MILPSHNVHLIPSHLVATQAPFTELFLNVSRQATDWLSCTSLRSLDDETAPIGQLGQRSSHYLIALGSCSPTAPQSFSLRGGSLQLHEVGISFDQSSVATPRTDAHLEALEFRFLRMRVQRD